MTNTHPNLPATVGIPDPSDELALIETGELNGQRWQITNVGQADWAMRRLASLKGRRDEYLAWAAEWSRLAGTFKDGVEFFEGHLKRYGLAQRAIHETATVRIPSGTIATKSNGSPRLSIDDEEAVLEWAVEHDPDAIKTTSTVHVSKVTHAKPWHPVNPETGELDVDTWIAVDDNGNEVPGMSVAVPEVTATVKPIATGELLS